VSTFGTIVLPGQRGLSSAPPVSARQRAVYAVRIVAQTPEVTQTNPRIARSSLLNPYPFEPCIADTVFDSETGHSVTPVRFLSADFDVAVIAGRKLTVNILVASRSGFSRKPETRCAQASNDRDRCQIGKYIFAIFIQTQPFRDIWHELYNR